MVFLRCNTNNRGETVLGLFREAVNTFGLPTRVRCDHGTENIEVARMMLNAHGVEGNHVPGIVNRTFENRTQSNSIELNPWIEFGNRTKSNTTLSVSSISEQIEFNRTNRTQSNSIRLIVFD